jgi:alpha-tubulin suppressor-like RCC1 family protein
MTTINLPRWKSATRPYLMALATTWLVACGGGSDAPITLPTTLPATPTSSTQPAPVLTLSGNENPYVNTLYTYEATVTGATATGHTWNWGDGSANSVGNPASKVWNRVGSFTASLSGSVSGTALTGSKTGSVKAIPVAPSYNHTCNLLTDGTVTCQGSNSVGQLGNGTLISSTTPVAVTGLTGVKALSVGNTHTCALKTDGTVACWGRNSSGELGNGTTTSSNVPVIVTGVTGATTIESGTNHTCVIKSDTTVACWGDNLVGKLGSGVSGGVSTTAVAVTGLTGAVQVVGGDNHTCVLKSDTSVVCFGNNSNGQLGNNTLVNANTPVPVSGLSGVAAIGNGYNSSCALKTDGTVMCWGFNAFAQLGDGSTTDKLVPTTVSGLAGVISLNATGAFSTCALKSTGTVACWGYNATGGLGDGTTIQRATPVPVTVAGVSGIVAIAGRHGQTTCAIKADNTQICWGTPASS